MPASTATGQKELVEAITCLTRCDGGRIVINGAEIQNTTTRNVLDHGICTIHEDRHKRGLVLSFSVAENMVIENYRQTPVFQGHRAEFPQDSGERPEAHRGV